MPQVHLVYGRDGGVEVVQGQGVRRLGLERLSDLQGHGLAHDQMQQNTQKEDDARGKFRSWLRNRRKGGPARGGGEPSVSWLVGGNRWRIVWVSC
jgi:hypothetical protein